MNRKIALVTLTMTLISTTAVAGHHMEMQPTAAEIHLSHVDTAWNDTPDGKGFLSVAKSEAAIAATHATIALKQPTNLQWLKSHSDHVRHALTGEGNGPGTGYGLLKATQGVVKHITVAAKSDGATQGVKLHSVHVRTSAENSLKRAKEMVALIREIKASDSAAEAAVMVEKLAALATALESGIDNNGDGVVSWVKDEGGLEEASKHMTILRNGLKSS